MTLPQYSFTCPGRPRPKERPRLGRRGRVFTPTRTLEYERAVRLVASTTIPSDWDTTGEFKVTMLLVFKPGATPDCDNVCKAVNDALNGVCWDDDRQIVEMNVRRETGTDERTSVVVTRVGEGRKRRPSRRKKTP